MKIGTNAILLASSTALGAAAAIAVSIALGLGVSASAAPTTAVVPETAAAGASPEYPRNSDGLTYGTIDGVDTIEDMPDLVSIWVDEDTIGYVPKEVLFPASPAQARALATTGEREDNTVTAFETDGETVIGDVFLGTSVEAPVIE